MPARGCGGSGARECGMPVGLYHDLAIGSIGNGSDVWMAQDLFASGIDVGAPLDDFNPTGQNWDSRRFCPSGFGKPVRFLHRDDPEEHAPRGSDQD